MPPTILTAVILAVVGSGGFGTLVAWLLRRVDERGRDSPLSEGVRVLLLCKLEQMQAEMVANHGIADNDLKARAQKVYDAYHALGGNGHGTQLNNDIQDAPIAPRQ
ncbi:MAG: hypothetical protein LKF49_01275 [Bifidobacterium tibiigranuli]|jgi:hypothetical protein|uniref:hypothetical protein n=1 Tax=Bifidobacterium tibiigranuli TaxID=2172043 RepID=UPI002354A0A8|nr:hypothetical protein [Bifidobacterium tibiigranuli]MCH3975080.1 hypothetical protein [Bifidobacterium tibiigranuli]MCH4202838.1 hypothetical protein [Bifidobacterium tibiigranuli]MCH4274910.1 hypothetical protein [Bifidobacterium tibiigranuli]